MSPSPADRGFELNELVITCLGRMDAEGASALESLCREHPEKAAALRERIALLRNAGLLDGEASEGAEKIPERLGDFRLVRLLGQGGMGVVYLAQQESLGRRVALKLVRPEHLYFPGARERFRREVEAVARMSHPGIVPVHTVGEESGVPFFAMEYVVGLGLDRAISALAERPLASLNGRDLAALLELADPQSDSASDSSAPSRVFELSWPLACAAIALQVAEALEHAHQRGVMHRDVKPSNIMLRRDGRALLLDFGLASLAGDEGLTKSGSQMGSLPWMPPEVAQGAADVSWARADVYSLGATLYELCALRRPFRGANAQELTHNIVAGQAESLRRLNARVGRDLEVVCATAMEADPARRYASAGALARDLANVLALRPIEARPPGPGLRALRFAQRHPGGSAVAALIALVAVVGPLTYAEQQRQARIDLEAANALTAQANTELTAALRDVRAANAQTAQANADLNAALLDVRTERDHAQREQGRAESNLDRAFQAVDLMLTRVGDKKLANVPQMELVRRELLESALAFYKELLPQKLDDPALRLEFARAHERVGDVLLQLARYAEAERAFRSEVELLRGECIARPEDLGALAELGPALSKLGTALQQESQFDLAEPVYREAIETFRELKRRDPSRNVDPSLASLSYNLGVIDRRLKRLMQADEAFGWAQEIEVARVKAHPEDPDLAYRAGLTVLERALILHEAGESERAIERLREAIVLFDSAQALQSSNAAYANAAAKAHNELADVLAGLERHAEAVAELETARNLFVGLARDYPNVPVYRIGLASTEASRAQLLEAQGDGPGSELAMRQARDAFAQLARDYPDLADYHGNLGLMQSMLAACLLKNGKTQEQIAVLREALVAQREGLRLAPISPMHAQLLSERRADLARALVRANALEEAAALALLIPDSVPQAALAQLAAAGVLADCGVRATTHDGAPQSRYSVAALERLDRALALEAAAVLGAVAGVDYATLRALPGCDAALRAARARD